MIDTKDFLSDLVVYSKYSNYAELLRRRENWLELNIRNAEMHSKRYPHISDEIFAVYARSVASYKVVPSMRSYQFAGKAIEVNHSRMFNCASRKLDSAVAFAEVMFLLLGGSGVGISVQRHHIAQIPAIRTPLGRNKKFVVSDDIMGWADAIKVLIKSYTGGKTKYNFDFSEIRPKGSRLVTAGGKAPGPEPLRKCINKIKTLLDRSIEDRGDLTKMTPVEAHDIACFIANAVLAGGIRRSAMISLFSDDDEEMLLSKGNFPVKVVNVTPRSQGDDNPHIEFEVEVEYKDRIETVTLDQWTLDNTRKTGTIPWYKLEEQRGRANNSVMLHRDKISETYFRDMMKTVEASKAGEPGVYWTNDYEMGTNPCCEISLDFRGGFCNLTEVNVSDVESYEDLVQRVKDATFLGTLQAGYTDFHYLGHQWKEIADRDALLGVSMTGIGSGEILKYDIEGAAKEAVKENIRVAKLIGINPAKRIGTIKPSGTASLVLGSSSGIHAWHNDHYIRRMRLNKDEAIFDYLQEKLGSEFIEDDSFDPETTGVIGIPIKAPKGSILRTETPIALLERVKKFQIEWIRGSHTEGVNTHNVSVTVSIKPDEWDTVTQWMWDNKQFYNGISVLDYDGGTYPQMPFTDCTVEEYDRLHGLLVEAIKDFDITDIKEDADYTDLKSEAACSGGACELSAL